MSPDDRDRDTVPAAAPLVILAGHAESALAEALQQVALATANLEALAMAVARQLDAQATSEAP